MQGSDGLIERSPLLLHGLRRCSPGDPQRALGDGISSDLGGGRSDLDGALPRADEGLVETQVGGEASADGRVRLEEREELRLALGIVPDEQCRAGGAGGVGRDPQRLEGVLWWRCALGLAVVESSRSRL